MPKWLKRFITSAILYLRGEEPVSSLIVPEESDIDRFRKTCESWLPYIEWVSVSAVALKTREGLKLFSGRVSLFRHGMEPEPGLNVDTTHLQVRKRLIRCDTKGAADFLENALQGKISIEDSCEFRLVGTSIKLLPHPIRSPGVTADIRVPTCVVIGDEKSSAIREVGGYEALDWEVRAHTPPFYSLDELLGWMGLPNCSAMGDMSLLQLSVVPPATIEGNLSAISKGRVKVCVWGAPKLPPENISLQVRGLARDGRQGSVIPLRFEATAPVVGKPYDVMEFGGDVAEEAVVQAFLNVGGLAVQQLWIGDPERRLHIAQPVAESFDENLATLDAHLFSTRNDQSERFEWAVGTLLFLLGFKLMPLGKNSPLTDGPDVVAVTPNGNVAVVECTIQLPGNKDKVGKVLQRATRVREQMAKSGFVGGTTLPVVVTRVPRDQVGDARREVTRRGVLVLDKEDLQGLRRRIIVPPNPDQLFSEGIALLEGAKSTGD
jgi:hypothetical protein